MNGTQCTCKAPTASNMSTFVLEAAASGDVETLRSLLGNPNARDSKGVPALHLAAAGGHVQTVGALLEGGACVDVLGPGLVTALHVATSNGHVDVVRFLLQKGANYKKRDTQGNTPLMLAVKGKQWAIVCLFVERGADPKETIVEEKSALTAAAAEGEVKSVLLMCRDLKKNGKLLKTDLQKALSYAKNAAVLWSFEDAFPETIYSEGGEALLEAVCDGRQEAVEVLLDAGVPIEYRGRQETVEVLLDAGVPIQYRKCCQNTPLIVASINGQTECVKKLLQRGARIDAVDYVRNTALHLAAKNGKEDVVRELLRAGADANLKNISGSTALDVANSQAVKNIISNTAKHSD